MKKVLKSIVVLTLLLTVSVSFAKEPILNVVANQDKVLDIKLDTSLNEIIMHIIDINDELIFSELIDSESTYTKKFNLKSLPVGTYYVNFDDVTKKTVFTVVITQNDISILKKEEKFKPVYNYKNGKLVMNFINLDKKDVEILIVDSDGRTVFEELIIDENKIGKVFNFTEAFEDTYTIIVKNKNNTYYKNIEIE